MLLLHEYMRGYPVVLMTSNPNSVGWALPTDAPVAGESWKIVKRGHRDVSAGSLQVEIGQRLDLQIAIRNILDVGDTTE